jgi:hypothetical protein
MNPVMNPLALRAAFLLCGSVVAFGLALFLMRQLRRYLVSESESMDYSTSTFSDQSSKTSPEKSLENSSKTSLGLAKG